MITIFSYNPDKMMYRLHEFDNDSVDRYFDVPAEELYRHFSWANGGKNKMDTKRNYHYELNEFVSDDRVTKESVINALSDVIAACEQHDELLTKLSNGNGCFADTLQRIMNELTPKPDPLDESNKSPRIDCEGDKWEWSEFLGQWVMTEPNKITKPNVAGISPDDPGYCHYYSNLKFTSVSSLSLYCGAEYASV